MSQCATQSVGPANQLFGLLIQTILAAQCNISPPDMWPKDYGPTAIEKGNENNIQIYFCSNKIIRILCDVVYHNAYSEGDS